MSQPRENSVTVWIADLKEGDSAAAEQLFERYFENLARLAEKRLAGNPQRVADGKDLAQEVFTSLVLGAAKGQYPKLTDRHDLWSLLIAITRHKAADLIKHQTREKRGGGNVRGESIFNQKESDGRPLGIAAILDQAPTSADLVEYDDQLQWLLKQLNDEDHSGMLGQVALLKFERFSNAEIAKQLDCVERTVERKLERIRHIWLKDLDE